MEEVRKEIASMYQCSDLYCFQNKKLYSFSKDKDAASGRVYWLESFASSELHQEWKVMILSWGI